VKTEGPFDLVVLGSGSTAFAAAIRAAEAGKTAALIESRVLGGTCVNRGCLPSKNLIAAAAALHEARNPRFPGVSVAGVQVDLGALIRGKDRLVTAMRDKKYESVAEGLSTVRLFDGRARLEPDGSVWAGDRRILARNVLVAVGARPFVPPIEGLESVPYLTSDLLSAGEPEELEDLPRSIAVLGGGYIACELGQAFARLGSRVTILERSEGLLGGFEPEVGKTVARFFGEEGIEVWLSASVRSVRAEGSGLRLVVEQRGQVRELSSDRLLVAAGRRPNTDGIGLERAGVALDERGFVRVDDHLRTTRPGVWAAGDAIGEPMATPVGAHEGAIAADNALRGAQRKVDRRSIPRAVFTDPPIAAVGRTDREAVRAGIRCRCRTVSLEHVPRAAAVHRTTGFVKIVAESGTDRLVGVTMVGEGAAEVIHEAAMALRFGATLDDLIDQIHIYPTMAEALKIGALAFRKDIARLSCCAE
jgi:mercuric reductase